MIARTYFLWLAFASLLLTGQVLINCHLIRELKKRVKELEKELSEK